MEWLLVKDRRHDSVFHFERYCRDLLRDPFYQKVERKLMWLWIYLAHAVAITAMGYAFGLYQEGTRQAAFQMAASWLVWGVFLRTVFTMHVTWAVNSVCHKWGYRNYQTRDESTNSWWVALLTFGEGWHNNHHADPRSARHGHRWFEFDMSWFLIRLFEKIGLASQVVGPRLRLGTIANEAIDEMPE
jgi:stearoyl-CoA desaturase (delta-9 desaturase)